MHSGKRPLSPELVAGKKQDKEELCCSTLSESDVSAFVSELTDQPAAPSVDPSLSLPPQGNSHIHSLIISQSYIFS